LGSFDGVDLEAVGDEVVLDAEQLEEIALHALVKVQSVGLGHELTVSVLKRSASRDVGDTGSRVLMHNSVLEAWTEIGLGLDGSLGGSLGGFLGGSLGGDGRDEEGGGDSVDHDIDYRGGRWVYKAGGSTSYQCPTLCLSFLLLIK
jgi:hypothetical protein